MNPTIRGIVLDSGDGSVLLLTEDGELRSVPWPGELPEAGAVVVGPAGSTAGRDDADVLPARPAEGATRPARRFWRALVAAAAAALVPLAWWLGSGRSRPVLPALAVVAVDINPSVELWVGDGGAVLRAHPQNPDGERVLAQLDLTGVPAPAAAAAVVRRAAELGYLAGPEPAVLVTVVDLKPQAGRAAGSPPLEPAQPAGAVEAELRAGPPAPALVVVQRVPKGVLDEARRSGLPVGVCAAVERARGLSLPVDSAAVKAEGLRRALAAAGTTVGSLYAAPPPPEDPQAPLVLRTGATGAEAESPAPADDERPAATDTDRAGDRKGRGDQAADEGHRAIAPGAGGAIRPDPGRAPAGTPAGPPEQRSGKGDRQGAGSAEGPVTPPADRPKGPEDEQAGRADDGVPEAEEAGDSGSGPRGRDSQPSPDEPGDEPADEQSGSGGEENGPSELDGKDTSRDDDGKDEKDDGSEGDEGDESED